MEGAVPPHVMGEYASFLPGFFVGINPFDAFLTSSHSFEYVRDAMAGPNVVFVDLYSTLTKRFSLREVVVFLQRESTTT